MRYIFPLIILPFLFACDIDGSSSSNSFDSSNSSDCDFQENLCIKGIENIEVMLDVEPKPLKAFKETVFVATIKGSESLPDELLMDLTMPGMFMGENRVVLRRAGSGIYRGKGVIPRCPSGKTLWQAEIFIPEKGSVSFRFHVK